MFPDMLAMVAALALGGRRLHVAERHPRSVAQFLNLASDQALQRGPELRDEWQKVDEAIGPRPKNDDSKRTVIQSLLLREALVNRNQDVEVGAHHVEQGTVIEVGPSQVGRCPHVVSRQLARQPLRHAGVQQHTHGARAPKRTLRGYGLRQ